METTEEYPHGAQLLDATERWMRRFVHFSSDSHHVITALWVAGVHMTETESAGAREDLVHLAYARLGFVSDEPGSGKTTAMERALYLCPRGELLIQPSMAGIMDALDERETIALDEADKYFGKRGGAQTNVIGFINAGYRKGGGTVRFKNRKVDSFAPMLYSGLLEALGINPALTPLRTRSMLLEMHAAPDGVKVEEFDAERHEYAQTLLRDALSSWGKVVAPLIPGTPAMDAEGVTNRRAQLWRPLLRVALLAGGEWPQRALQACQELESGLASAPPSLTPEQRLMGDVYAIAGRDSQLPTEELIRRLHSIPNAPWRYVLPDPTGTGSARDLAAYMGAHGLSPRPFRNPELPTLQLRGYALSEHVDCLLCPQTRSQTDDFCSQTDDSEDVTDEPGGATDADTHVIAPPVRPSGKLPPPPPVFRFG